MLSEQELQELKLQFHTHDVQCEERWKGIFCDVLDCGLYGESNGTACTCLGPYWTGPFCRQPTDVGRRRQRWIDGVRLFLAIIVVLASLAGATLLVVLLAAAGRRIYFWCRDGSTEGLVDEESQSAYHQKAKLMAGDTQGTSAGGGRQQPAIAKLDLSGVKQ